jgi:hypothetical protein
VKWEGIAGLEGAKEEVLKEFISREPPTYLAFTRHKAASAAIGEGVVEILRSPRGGHCDVYCGWD